MTVGMYGGKFLPFHQGHIHVVMKAMDMVDKLYVVLSSSEIRDRKTCTDDGIKYMPKEVRMSWLGEFAAEYENIFVVNVDDDWSEKEYDWEEGANMIKVSIPEEITHVFGSEPEYYTHHKHNFPRAEYIVVDENREAVPISATDIRRNVYRHWNMMPKYVRSYFAKKVAIVGTESCGKSTLAKKLASHYNTNYIHEVGRDYCVKYSDQLTVGMFNSIAMDHFRLQEERVVESNKVLFVDSEAVVTQYYLDMYFNTESSFIEEVIKLQDYDLILYLEPDVPWVYDGIRFAGEQSIREENNKKLKKMFEERGIKFQEISGSYEERFRKAQNLVNYTTEV